MSKLSRSECGKLGALKTNELWKQRYSDNPTICKNCNKILPYEKRKNIFCDSSCSASFNNIGIVRNEKGQIKGFDRPKRNKYKRNKIKISYIYKCCLGCDQKIIDRNYNKYCSIACQR